MSEGPTTQQRGRIWGKLGDIRGLWEILGTLEETLTSFDTLVNVVKVEDSSYEALLRGD